QALRRCRVAVGLDVDLSGPGDYPFFNDGFGLFSASGAALIESFPEFLRNLGNPFKQLVNMLHEDFDRKKTRSFRISQLAGKRLLVAEKKRADRPSGRGPQKCQVPAEGFFRSLKEVHFLPAEIALENCVLKVADLGFDAASGPDGANFRKSSGILF